MSCRAVSSAGSKRGNHRPSTRSPPCHHQARICRPPRPRPPAVPEEVRCVHAQYRINEPAHLRERLPDSQADGLGRGSNGSSSNNAGSGFGGAAALASASRLLHRIKSCRKRRRRAGGGTSAGEDEGREVWAEASAHKVERRKEAPVGEAALACRREPICLCNGDPFRGSRVVKQESGSSSGSDVPARARCRWHASGGKALRHLFHQRADDA